MVTDVLSKAEKSKKIEKKTNKEKCTIDLSHVTVSFGHKIIHRDLTFSVAEGELLGIIGPNGAGKTTLLRMLLGLLKPEKGSITICGKEVRGRGSSLLGYVPQSRLIDPETPLEAWDFVSFGLNKDFLRPWLTKNERAQIKEIFRLVGAEAYMHKSIGLLSGGERQRLFLAQALLSNPKCLLLDEPTAALDPGSQERIVELVDHVRRQLGITVSFISHDINLIARYADRILYLANGEYAIGTRDEVMTTEVLTRLYRMPTEVIRSEGKILVSTAASKDHASICVHPDSDMFERK